MRTLPNPAGPPEMSRVNGAMIFALVLVGLQMLGLVLGGWAVLAENRSRQEHGQDPLTVMAWIVALYCWAQAALHGVCLVLARRRRPWVRVALIVCLTLMSLSALVRFLNLAAAEADTRGALLVFVLDVAALWTVCGESGDRWFSVPDQAPTSSSTRPAQATQAAQE